MVQMPVPSINQHMYKQSTHADSSIRLSLSHTHFHLVLIQWTLGVTNMHQKPQYVTEKMPSSCSITRSSH